MLDRRHMREAGNRNCFREGQWNDSCSGWSDMFIKFLFGIAVALALFLNSCAAIMDGNYVTRDGKKSPFQKQRDVYEIPKDPTENR